MLTEHIGLGVHMLDTFPGESCVCLLFAAGIGCTAFTASGNGTRVSLAFPWGNVCFPCLHHRADLFKQCGNICNFQT